MASPKARFRRLHLLVRSFALGLVALACSRGGEPTERRGPSDAGTLDDGGLAPRAEVVARADALALAASKLAGERAVLLLAQAAELRERLFRVEHREADGLEAVELWGQAAQASSDHGCEATLRQAVLEAELRQNPALAFQRIEEELGRTKDPRCRASCSEVLTSLGPFRPEKASAAASAQATGPAAPDAAASAPPLAPGAVVVPEKSGVKTGPAAITEIERYGAKDAARVVVHVTHPALFEVHSLDGDGTQGARLVVDLTNVTSEKSRTLAVGGLVERVRVGAQTGGTRVVLDLSRPAYRRVFYLPEPFRLVIDVSKDPPVGFAAGASGPRVVRRVVLDPGHGGHDPGATGPGGLREKDVTLDVAHRAAPLLARELGISTLLTRDSDSYVALDERTARANAFGADLLISIHCNASEDGAGKGVMSFVLDGSRDTLSARVAARENSASEAAASELANALSAVLDRSVVDRSDRLALLLQRATLASLAARYADVPDLGVRRAGFYVLAGATMPAVLFETSFISNPPGEERLGTPDYRQKLADGIVNAVRAYRDGR